MFVLEQIRTNVTVFFSNVPCLKDDILPGGWILLSSLSSIQMHKGKKKMICIHLLLPGFSHLEGRGACVSPRLLGHRELRAPSKSWAPPGPPASSEAHSSHPCRPGIPQEPSGATACTDIRSGRGGGQAVVSPLCKPGGVRAATPDGALWPLVTSAVSVTSALSENGLRLQQSSDR